MTHAHGRFESATLPKEEAARTICCPTRSRWQDAAGNTPGELGRWIRSIATKLESENLAEDSRIVIGDQTADCDIQQKTANIVWAIHHPDRPVQQRPEIFLQDTETRTLVADEVRERLRPCERVLENLLLRSGYAQSRLATELPLLGKVLSMDDDTSVPASAPVLEICLDDFPGTVENSQILHSSDRFSDLGGQISMRPNRIGAAFEPLGRTVSDLRRGALGSVPVSFGRSDTMHLAFERMLQKGEPSRFSISHAEPVHENESRNIEIAAIAITEYGIPDFRTVAIVDATISNAGRPIEHRTIPAGENGFFAFRHSETHISSCIARNLRIGLDNFPWWFLTDDRISRRNPLQTVRTSYRSDNELIANLLLPLSTAIGQPLAYGQGVSTRVLHQPANTGHRPNLPEQAAASLVGAMIAVQVQRHLEFSPGGVASLPEISDSYKLPKDAAVGVFEQLESLATSCLRVANAETSLPDTITWCEAMYGDLSRRLADFNLSVFKAELDIEARDQLRFYRDVLLWYPRVRRYIIDEMVRKDRFPVKRYID
ncbi:hypothetical protein SV7mr_19030 [Stieleria bergensis]|uniref:Uncharacterized protein n=1 Tax=Stieleria bergensis TaxID=2528025 RepID=A0A517STE2_9BACT|nr:hypothetical protein SV7mr_19030 [Planctomycetes bacterium SV_7m_r]